MNELAYICCGCGDEIPPGSWFRSFALRGDEGDEGETASMCLECFDFHCIEVWEEHGDQLRWVRAVVLDRLLDSEENDERMVLFGSLMQLHRLEHLRELRIHGGVMS